jgi:hypothetical protein
MTVSDTRPWQPEAMITSRIPLPEIEVQHAARRLVTLFGGRAARIEAAERAARLARQARWPEHDVAMRVLTVVETLAEERNA